MAGMLIFTKSNGDGEAFVPLRAIQAVQYKKCRDIVIDRNFIPEKYLEGSVVNFTLMSGQEMKKYFASEKEGWEYYEDLKSRIEKD